MIVQQSSVQNRMQAGSMLAERLGHLKNAHTMVFGVPYGGAVVGAKLAEKLNTSFDVIPCVQIHYPGDFRKTIGSVSADHVLIHDPGYDTPSDYLQHEIRRKKTILKLKQELYGSQTLKSVKREAPVVIVVGDVIKSADAVWAAIKSLEILNPKKIVLAATLVYPDVFSQLSHVVDEIVTCAEGDLDRESFYEENTIIKDEDIRDLVQRAQERQQLTAKGE